MYECTPVTVYQIAALLPSHLLSGGLHPLMNREPLATEVMESVVTTEKFYTQQASCNLCCCCQNLGKTFKKVEISVILYDGNTIQDGTIWYNNLECLKIQHKKYTV